MKGVNTFTLHYLYTMTRSPDDIHTYYQQALDLINEDHPHFEEIKRLLIDQVNDELHDHDSNYVTD